MTTNPVLKREMRVSSRSVRLPIIISSFNFILAAFVLVSMIVTIGQAKRNAQINYAIFLTIFRYVAAIEFALLLFIMPALTAGSISSERERRTLDLLLSTKVTPKGIVWGKMLASLSTMLLLVLSSLPILMIASSYGGVTAKNLLTLAAVYIVTSVYSGSIGIWASSFMNKSGLATSTAYMMLLILTGGTIGINFLAGAFSSVAGRWEYILMLNPIYTFYKVINGNTGIVTLREMIIQLGIAAVFILLAIRNVDPQTKRGN